MSTPPLRVLLLAAVLARSAPPPEPLPRASRGRDAVGASRQSNGEASDQSAIASRRESRMSGSRDDLPGCFRSTGARATKSRSGTVVVTLGTGAHGAVFAPISWEDACQWKSQAIWLAKEGFRIATLSWGSSRAQSVRDAVGELRAQGATSVVLIGACVGGTAALDRAAELAEVVRGVVAVSPLVAVAGSAVGAEFAAYRGPVLMFGTRNDPLTPTKALWDIDRMRETRSDVRIFDGNLHGVDIFNDAEHGPIAHAQLRDFLSRAFAS